MAGSRMLRQVNKRKRFNIILSVREIEGLLDRLPEEGEVYKFLSTGGFSSISFVRFIAKRAKILELTAFTLRVGKKEMQALNVLHSGGRLEKANFLIGSFMKNDSKTGLKYGYYQLFDRICGKNGWNYTVVQNHSKILLFETEVGKFVIETSSNLNENPKMEQFSFEKNAELYDFYFSALDELVKGGSKHASECEKRGCDDEASDQSGEVGEGGGGEILPAGPDEGDEDAAESQRR